MGKRGSLRGWIASFGRGLWRPRLSTADHALVGAHGKALTVLVTALQARGHLDAEEFSHLLGIFSVVVSDEDDLEGSILAVWAGIIQESMAGAGPVAADP